MGKKARAKNRKRNTDGDDLIDDDDGNVAVAEKPARKTRTRVSKDTAPKASSKKRSPLHRPRLCP